MTSQSRFGFFIALGTAAVTLLAFVLAALTPPISGPFCTASCIDYPYLNVAARFPRDYYWMFPAMLSALLFLALVVVQHGRAPAPRKIVATLGLVLAAMAALVLIGVYFVQLEVVQRSLVHRETDGVALLSQYNPHGLFIALEELGYSLMSLSLVCVGATLSGQRVERAARAFFYGGFALTLLTGGAAVGFLGHTRGYIFEVAIITIDWTVLTVGAALLALAHRREPAAPSA